MSRTIACGVAALALSALAVAGCSPGGSSDQTTITYLSWDGEDIMVPVLEAFHEAHPNIRVEPSYAPPVQEYISTLQTRILSGTAPDVFMIAAENRTNLIEGEFVLDLAGEDFLANVPEFNQRTYGEDGAVYGLSIASWGAGIMYNRDLLAGVGYDAPPATWDEFLELSHTLQDAGVDPYLEAVDGSPLLVAGFLGAHNASIDFAMDDLIFSGESTFAEQWTPSLEQYIRLFDEGLVTRDAVGLTGDQVQTEFRSGRVAMVVAGPWTIGPVREAAPDLDFAVAPIPGIEGRPQYVAGAASPGFAINSSSDNIEAAKEFLAYLSSTEGIEVYQGASGNITVTTDFDPDLDPALDPLIPEIRAGNVYLPQIGWQRSQDILNAEAIAQIQRMVLGEITPRQFAEALDQKLATS